MFSKFLLHVCCAPCSAHVIDLLSKEYDLTLFFYNPNIQPHDEYVKRLEEAKKHALQCNIPFMEGDYEVKKWKELIRGHENDSERGERCQICYRMRLVQTAKQVKSNGFALFGTTLTISPHKDATMINKIGQELAKKYDLNFYEADFKKKDGFKKTMQIACEHGFYRQDYCGCPYGL